MRTTRPPTLTGRFSPRSGSGARTTAAIALFLALGAATGCDGQSPIGTASGPSTGRVTSPADPSGGTQVSGPPTPTASPSTGHRPGGTHSRAPRTPARPSAVVTIDGVGPFRIGMTEAQARAANGGTLVVRQFPDPSVACGYATPGPALPGVSLTFLGGRLARVDVVDPSPVRTRSGIGIGSTEAAVWETYPDRISVTDMGTHGGGNLVFTPRSAADAGRLVLFEVARGRVSAFRAGDREAVALQEGCA